MEYLDTIWNAFSAAERAVVSMLPALLIRQKQSLAQNREQNHRKERQAQPLPQAAHYTLTITHHAQPAGNIMTSSNTRGATVRYALVRPGLRSLRPHPPRPAA